MRRRKNKQWDQLYLNFEQDLLTEAQRRCEAPDFYELSSKAFQSTIKEVEPFPFWNALINQDRKVV